MLSTVQMSPRQKEALRLHLQIFKLQRDLKGCQKLYRKEQIALKLKLLQENQKMIEFEQQNPGKINKIVGKVAKYNSKLG